MKNMTKQEAIEKHRELWSWIAEQTRILKRYVSKRDYFYRDGEWCNAADIPFGCCYCCEYANTQPPGSCESCPVEWNGGYCNEEMSEYTGWRKAKTWEESARWADRIARLPERT